MLIFYHVVSKIKEVNNKIIGFVFSSALFMDSLIIKQICTCYNLFSLFMEIIAIYICILKILKILKNFKL